MKKVFLLMSTLIGAATISYAQYPTTGNFAYWNFNGTNLEDSSTNNNDLATNGTVTYGADRFGKTDKAWDGGRTYFATYPTPSAAFTYGMWIRPINTPSFDYSAQAIFSQFSYAQSYTGSWLAKKGRFQLYIDTVSGKDSFSVNFEQGIAGSTNPNYTSLQGGSSSKLIAKNAWTHVAISMSATGTLKFYINGLVTDSIANFSPMLATESAIISGYNIAADLIIGSSSIVFVDLNTGSVSSVNPFLGFEGKIDEIFAYTTELDAAQIITLMKNDEPKIPASIGKNNFSTTKEKVYPNPAATVLNVSNTTATHYSIVNAQGQIVKQNTYHNNMPINIEKLTSGIYVLQLNGKEGSSSIKFTKE